MAIINGVPKSINPNSGIKGFDIVLSNLHKEIQKIEGRSVKGLIKAAIHIRKYMAHTPPLIPIDTGNLRASWFVVTEKSIESKPPIFDTSKDKNIQTDYNAAVTEAQGIAQASTEKIPFVVIGFGTNYAAPVHERIGDINWSKPNTGPKFLQSAVKMNKDKIIKIIAENAQIKK